MVGTPTSSSPPPPSSSTPAASASYVSPRNSRDFRNLAKTQADEDAYDFLAHRKNIKYTNVLGSVSHIVKGALGGGILSGHVAYWKSGNVLVGLSITVFFGIYMSYCLHLLIHSSQLLYKRTRIPVMSYADVGEASCMLFPNPKVQRWSKVFRHCIDAIICIDLFGSCCCYQIIIAKSVKQLVENVKDPSFAAAHPGYPSLRIYLLIGIPIIIVICLIRHLKYLAPLSLVANIIILFIIGLSVYYAFVYNPTFKGIFGPATMYGAFETIGMIVFSMSCAGVVIPIENNMAQPQKFPFALTIGMSLIILCLSMASFFGYAAFLHDSEAPITLNFPMTTMPKILKGLIALMIYVTHALNFWAPFNLVFYYIKKHYPPERWVFWELVWRAIFVTIIGFVAIIFPDINALMGFIGSFCLSNMAFIWPSLINLLVIWERPGFGRWYFRLWRSLVLLGVGIFIFICGTLVNFTELVRVFISINVSP